MDLAATDVLRIRERGVPRYNQFRRLFRLKPADTFEELTDNPTWAEELRRVYGGDVERVDLMIGLYGEPKPKGFGFSDTAFRVFILMASRRLKSDRFFTRDYTPKLYTQAGMRLDQRRRRCPPCCCGTTRSSRRPSTASRTPSRPGAAWPRSYFSAMFLHEVGGAVGDWLAVPDADDLRVERGESRQRVAVLLFVELEPLPPGLHRGPGRDRVADDQHASLRPVEPEMTR